MTPLQARLALVVIAAAASSAHERWPRRRLDTPERRAADESWFERPAATCMIPSTAWLGTSK